MRIKRNGIFYFVIVLALFATFYVFKDKLQLPQKSGTNFCTAHDEVLQQIKTDLEDWLVYFPDSNPILGFNVASGTRYTVDGGLWKSNDDPPILFVVTSRSWQEHYGNQGYWYSKPDKAYIDTRYAFEPLDGDIYCYRLKLPRP
ncbi:MAG: hypothetical protein H0X30_08725 [Anaerolineae bacterium]|nr:hypothetical protein [Anaerolineae bacterium]